METIKVIELSNIDAVRIDPRSIIIRDTCTRIRKDLGDIKEMADSIAQFGQINPILITRDNELVAGERRLRACELLNISVAAVYSDQLDDMTLREIELEENIKRKDMTWQERIMLVQAITVLKQEKLGTKGAGRGQEGWSLQDTADLMGKSKASVSMSAQLAKVMEIFPEVGNAKTEDDARKMVRKIEEKIMLDELMKRKSAGPKSYEFAENKFIIENALEALPRLASNIMDYADVDTPYGIDLEYNKKSSQTSTELKAYGNYTEIPQDEFLQFAMIIAKEVFRILKHDSWCTWWFGLQWYEPLKDILTNVGFTLDPLPGMWYAGAKAAQTNQPQILLAKSYDTFFLCRKGKPVLHKPGRHNVFECPKVDADKKIHPTEKPLAMYTELINTICFPGTTAIVPFLGSGNALRALFTNQCNGFGYELDEELRSRFLLRVEEDIKNKLYEKGE